MRLEKLYSIYTAVIKRDNPLKDEMEGT